MPRQSGGRYKTREFVCYMRQQRDLVNNAQAGPWRHARTFASCASTQYAARGGV